MSSRADILREDLNKTKESLRRLELKINVERGFTKGFQRENAKLWKQIDDYKARVAQENLRGLLFKLLMTECPVHGDCATTADILSVELSRELSK